MPLLVLSDAELAYGELPLLDRASFAMEAGERIGLIGRNGTGKSSLLAVIAGAAALDEGELRKRDGLAVALVEQEPVLPRAFTRFRMPWRWNGGPAILQSRAWDEAGNMQPTRAEFVAHRGQTTRPPSVLAFPSQHFNAITSWAVDSKGEVRHVYA